MDNNELYHYGVKGMKWGVRKNRGYTPMSPRAYLAKRANDKVDESFKIWKVEAAKKESAINQGKKANESLMAWKSDRGNKALKVAYKQDKRAYKKTLRSNTTYRKGAIREQVGKDLARKNLSAAKKVKKQWDKDPSNKALKREYYDLMGTHAKERAKARRAQSVAQRRSQKISSIKRARTMAIRSVAATAAISVGVGLTNRYLEQNGKRPIDSRDVKDVIVKAGKVMAAAGFIY